MADVLLLLLVWEFSVEDIVYNKHYVRHAYLAIAIDICCFFIESIGSISKKILHDVIYVIPITDGRLNLGTWQGIYFCEYRNYGGSRELVATIIGE